MEQTVTVHLLDMFSAYGPTEAESALWGRAEVCGAEIDAEQRSVSVVLSVLCNR